MSSGKEVQDWYNDFSKSQLKTSVNLRHFTVMNKLIDAGLKKHHKVLEIGCGIGTLTGLLAKYLKKNSLIATDISDKSVQIARGRMPKSKNVEFRVSDMSSFDSSHNFDFIVLPDVLEHIPIDQHNRLFGVLANLMHENTVLFIHIPHPKYLDEIRKHTPEKLQIIDQSIDAKQLLIDASYNGFNLISYDSYSLFSSTPDYALIKFRLNNPVEMKPFSQIKIIRKKSMNRVKFLFRNMF